MVYIGIPQHYTTSPSSFMGTPSLTINHEATQDLDSTNAFEGPEKLLEVWFAPSAQSLGSAGPAGLKAVPEEIWKDMLDLVNCQVLSIVSSEDVDAYLLSESSMFVWPHKLILKTCGTTTLLSGLPRILEIAALFGGFPRATAPASRGITVAAAPYRVFYSRKNFLFPDRQRGPHRSWRDEVRNMDRLFLNGSAYMIGKMNGEHWYLYLTEPNTLLTPPSSPRVESEDPVTETKILQVPEQAVRQAGEDQDETLEVLMTDLEEENAKQFYLEHATAVAEKRYRNFEADDDHVDVFSNNSDMDDVSSNGSRILPPELTTEGHALGTVVSESCGLSDVYPKSKFPESRIDAYLFTPCGFSANGVIPTPDQTTGTHYFTVHVTPEPQCSYASFETNVPHSQNGQTTAEIVQQVVNIFKPGRFTITLFEAKPEATPTDGDWDMIKEVKYLERQAARRTRMEHVEGYRRVDRIVHDLEGYDLVFRYYERLDWKGGAPRLGEERI
ncbi:S-adenosylmethionine decarboxylase proenzyme [Aspergillus ellipticus CBS 707.79]|uniref:adenosylmethionine decarboxylase n=1 Tax=Aspergillus ellipticus CBS 707.79 TaxID=1448320 RepID=A0A319DFQ6_9EURO|nr:S-adenosylmethionine decarboxylase proenzyme [Aspergillus ellipticus CBS 707.79]